MVRVLKKSAYSLYCSRDATVLYMLCITIKCVKSQKNYFLKKVQ